MPKFRKRACRCNVVVSWVYSCVWLSIQPLGSGRVTVLLERASQHCEMSGDPLPFGLPQKMIVLVTFRPEQYYNTMTLPANIAQLGYNSPMASGRCA